MNNNNLTEEITILKTWKGETIEIDMKYEDFLLMEVELKSKGQDGFNSGKHRRYIKFASIEDKIGKTKYMLLPEPDKGTPYHKLTKKEKDDIKIKIDEMMEKTYEARKKKFIDRRKDVLNKLKKEEEYFGLKTTQEKLSEYLQYIKQGITVSKKDKQ